MASTVDERKVPYRADSSSPIATNTPDVPHTNPDESSESQNLSSLKPIVSDEPTYPKSNATPADPNALATRALEFLSTATPTTLSAVAVGFATVTYAVLGKLGLVLIGAFGGVVGFISWQARNPHVAKIVQGEKGLDVVERLLHNLGEKTKECKTDAEDDESTLKTFEDFRPETKDALAGLVDATIRDYVKWWYSPIVPSDHSFPLACRKVLTTFLIGISNHLYRKRPADAFLDLLTNSSSMMIVFMSELASAFADLPPDSKMTAADAVYNYLAANPNSNLANLLNQKQQGAKFKMISEDMLGFLEQSSYNCSPARIFLREILANSVFEMMLQKCSKADYINAWIVYLLEDGEPDISQAIDVGMQTGRDAGSNVFADIDGNVGNVGLARPPQRSAHKKQLSRAEEEMDEAMEEMKRMNALIVKEQEARRKREASISEENRPLRMSGESDAAEQGKTRTPGDESPTSGRSFDKSSARGNSNDGFSMSAKSEAVPTPATPLSTSEYPSPVASPLEKHHSHFTNFDQIVPQSQPNEEEEQKEEKAVAKKAPLTLHNASFTLHDDISGDTAKIRMKPTWDYLIQVEPSSTDHSGWMIVRRYSDFETLHEILRRIAQISGATAFTELHKELPLWKIHTRESLRGELERYLRDACWYQSLAESEGMRRFLEKSQGHTHTNSKSFGWDTVSKNMLEGLTTAPKGLMEGSKTLVGGVTGVFGNFPGLVKRPSLQSSESAPNVSRLSISTPPRMDSMRSPARSERASMDSQRSSVISTQPGKMAPMERRPSYQSQGEDMGEPRMGRHDRMESASVSGSARQSREHSRAPSGAPLRSPSTLSLLDQLRLPPQPDEVGDDFEWSADGAEIHPKPLEKPIPSPAPSASAMKLPSKPARQHSQFTEPETRVAVELMFAVINEMYTLSSAWNIRRTLLTAAKSFLLRPGNPSLLNVQNLIQDSIIDGNTSDAAIAAQLRKLRENTMPTEQERAAWPAEATDEEKEKLRVKARALIIRSGVPAALMGVMGQAATGEALGRVFDCLQIEEVARGLFFGLMLQAVRIVTH